MTYYRDSATGLACNAGSPRTTGLALLSTTQGVGEEYDIYLDDTGEALLYWVRVTSGPVRRWVGYGEDFMTAYNHVGEQIAADLQELNR